MSWLKPKDPRLARLTELFFERFFYNDLIASEDDPQLDAANVMAMLAFPGLLMLHWVPKYYVQLGQAPEYVRAFETFGDRFFWLSFQMGVLALVATLQWERFYPERRDYAILGPQPVSIAELFGAQARALVRFLGLFFLLVNGFAALFFPLAMVPYRASLSAGLVFTFGHWLCLIASAAAAFAFVGCIQGMLIAALPSRWYQRFSTVFQSLLAASLILFIVAIPVLRSHLLAGSSTVAELVGSSNWLWVLPPAWFAAFGEWAAGRNVELFEPLALKALFSLASAVCLFVGAYLLTYRRFVAHSLEGPAVSKNREARLGAVARSLLRRWWLRDSLQYATFFFTLRMLVRSGPHRLYVGGYLAAGCGGVFSQLWTASNRGDMADVLLQQPYIVLFLVVAGMRNAFSIPADLTANWAFRFNLQPTPGRYLEGVRKALWTAAPLPLAVISSATAYVFVSPYAALVRLPVFLLACCFTSEAVMWRLSKIPFTCRYLAGRAHVIILWTSLIIGMFLYSSWFASMEERAFAHPWDSAGLLLLLPLLLRYARSPASELRFEDTDPFIEPLRLS
ncbi:MAG: hypothetical protein O3A53_00265 [Acidobacteria bacterium]|nr:hypothetical protein [Acidobacteriota bacterium]MDA1233213.1 hypothetical protein [Acidobacteriota bacterium]